MRSSPPRWLYILVDACRASRSSYPCPRFSVPYNGFVGVHPGGTNSINDSIAPVAITCDMWPVWKCYGVFFFDTMRPCLLFIWIVWLMPNNVSRSTSLNCCRLSCWYIIGSLRFLDSPRVPDSPPCPWLPPCFWFAVWWGLGWARSSDGVCEVAVTSEYMEKLEPNDSSRFLADVVLLPFACSSCGFRSRLFGPGL